MLGKGTLAVRVCEWFRTSPDWELLAVVPVVPEPTWTDSLSSWARAHGVEAIESGDWRELPGPTSPTLVISVFYDRILPAEFIDRYDRVLNVHNSPLPRYRGVSPINWALKNGEANHGVTMHEITPGIDDGPIVAQLTYSIYPEIEEVEDVYRRALEFGWVLFRETMPLLDDIQAVAQDHASATYYSARDNELLGERRHFTRKLSSRS